MIRIRPLCCLFCLSCFAFGYADTLRAGASAASPAARSDESRLKYHLLRSYDAAARPVVNWSSVVVIKFSISLIQISDLDEVNQVLTTNVWFEQEWFDEHLIWDAADFEGQRVIRLPCDAIWLPDIVLYNNAEDYQPNAMRSKVTVDNGGLVKWPPPARLRSSCRVDVAYFPFDVQHCGLKFGSWIYDGSQVDVVNRTDSVDLSNYVENGEWLLVRVFVERNVKYYPLFSEPYPDVTVTIVMKRRVVFYLMNIILPCLWLAMLSSVSFLLPLESGDKINLSITVLLAFSVFMLLVAENMPKTSESTPLIGLYLTLAMSMTALSILFAVWVLRVHHLAPRHTKAPSWLRSLAFVYVAKMLRMQGVVSDYIGQKITINEWPVSVELFGKAMARQQNSAMDLPGKAASAAAKSSFAADSLEALRSGCNRPCCRRPSASEEVLAGERGGARTVAAQATKDIVSEEWKLLAVILDRLLFCIFFLLNLTATTVVLAIASSEG